MSWTVPPIPPQGSLSDAQYKELLLREKAFLVKHFYRLYGHHPSNPPTGYVIPFFVTIFGLFLIFIATATISIN